MESVKKVLESTYQYLETGLEEIYEEIIESFKNEIKQLKEENQEIKLRCIELENDLNLKSNKIGELEDNQENYQKFSILQNFNKQINERDIEIKAYESKLRIAHGQIRQMALQLEDMRKEFNKPLKTQEELKEERLNLKEQEEEEENENQEDEEDEDEEEEEEEEIEYIKKKLASKYYYISNEEPKQIYEILDNKEVGECVGYYRLDGKPVLKKRK